MRKSFCSLIILCVFIARSEALWRVEASAGFALNVTTRYPILFVTQVPLPDYDSIASVFSNHHPEVKYAGRGGDLYIRYPNGTLKNLTAAALA